MINTEQTRAPIVRAASSSSERSRPHNSIIIIIIIIILTVPILQPAELCLPPSPVNIALLIASSLALICCVSRASSSSSCGCVLAASSPCLCPVARLVARLCSPVSVSCLGGEAHHPAQRMPMVRQEISHQKRNRAAQRNTNTI